MHIGRVNLVDGSLRIDPVPAAWEKLGGRGLIARILVDEVPGDCDPLGPRNKLIWSPGLLSGFAIPTCDRISVGAKSPLTGGVKESNAGGTTGNHLTRLGFKALILEGAPRQEVGWQVLHLDRNGARFDPADDLIGLGVHDSAQRLLARYGEDVAIALIGPGGELGLAAAGIMNLDKDKEPSRINARGGLGAVMGSKRLKALVIDSSGASRPAPAAPQGFKAARQKFTQVVMAHPQTKTFADFGTAAMVSMANQMGILPTRNFSIGRFEGAEHISGDALREQLLQRDGESRVTHACMAGCVIQCSNVYADETGRKVVAPLEYETIGLVGSNLVLDSLDEIATLNQEINDLGLDTIEMGAALGVAAEAGLMAFGDAAGAMALLHEVRAGTPVGRMLGNGATLTGRVLGVRHVPAVKGQAISAYDPRALKGTGVTYATSPQGADHTCGLTVRSKVDHFSASNQVEPSRSAQIDMAGWDTLGACIFSRFGFPEHLEVLDDLLAALYEWRLEAPVLRTLGRETLRLERAFNRQAGFTPANDRLPEWMTNTPLEPHNSVFDVPNEDLDQVFDGLE